MNGPDCSIYKTKLTRPALINHLSLFLPKKPRENPSSKKESKKTQPCPRLIEFVKIAYFQSHCHKTLHPIQSHTNMSNISLKRLIKYQGSHLNWYLFAFSSWSSHSNTPAMAVTVSTAFFTRVLLVIYLSSRKSPDSISMK